MKTYFQSNGTTLNVVIIPTSDEELGDLDKMKAKLTEYKIPYELAITNTPFQTSGYALVFPIVGS